MADVLETLVERFGGGESLADFWFDELERHRGRDDAASVEFVGQTLLAVAAMVEARQRREERVLAAEQKFQATLAAIEAGQKRSRGGRKKGPQGVPLPKR